MSGIRAYDAGRDGVAARLVAGAEALASRGNLVYVHVDGPQQGLAVFSVPDAGETARLGLVYTPPGAPLARFYRLVRFGVDELIALGFKKGRFEVRDAALLRRLQRTFRITAQPFGRDPLTGAPVSWSVEVDLEDALAQLGAVV